MLKELKLLLGISDTSKDALLIGLLDAVTGDVTRYTHDTDIAPLESVIVQMAIYRYNRLGSEGLNSESYNGFNYSYSDYPQFLLDILKSHRKMRTIQ